MKSKRLIILSFFLIFSLHSVYSQIDKLQASYIFNFLPEFEWPKENRTGNLIIGVLGDKELVVNELIKATTGKKVGSRSISVTSFSSVDNIGNCHVLFVPPKQSANLEKAVGKIGSSPVLIISGTSNGISQGAALNFVHVNNKLNFEVKPSNALKNKVRIGSSLIQLAVKVYK
jgi:hypothetical protein